MILDVTYNRQWFFLKKTAFFLLVIFFGNIVNAQRFDTSKFGAHPRLLMPAGMEKDINKNIETNHSLQKVHNDILAECDAMLSLYPVERALIGRRLLSQSREALRRIFFLAYAYRTTAKKKYFKKCEEEMLAIAKFSDWNPTHFLDVAEMSLAVSIGYDWLYNDLSPASRNVISKAIIDKAITPSLDAKYNGWLRGSNNWNQVCNTGITFGAIAVYEDQPKQSIALIERALSSIPNSMKTYAPDGNYAEGYSYWAYGTSFNVLLISAIETLFKDDLGLSATPGFLKTARFYESLMSPSGDCFNYSDCGGNNVLEPTMFWFANKLKDPSLLFVEKKYLDANATGVKFNRLLPSFMIWAHNIDTKTITAPNDKLWKGNGENPLAIIHTSWQDPNGIYVGFKAGTPSASHGHMDVGSFVMDAEGVRWSMDLGMQGYESLESKGLNIWDMKQTSQRWKVFRYVNQAHSTLTVNDALQDVDGKAEIISANADSTFTNTVIDMKGLYKKSLVKASRGIAVVNKQYVMVRDEIETGDSACTIRWSMVTKASVAQQNGTQMQLTNKGKKLALFVNGAPEAVMKTWPTDPPNTYDALNLGSTIVGFEITVPPHTKKAFNVFLVPGEQQIAVKKSSLKPLMEW